MSAALKRRLKDFDAKPTDEAGFAPADTGLAVGTPPHPVSESAAIDLDAERAAAHAAGYQAATDALTEEHGQAMARLADEHAAALAALKQHHEESVAAAIGERFPALLIELGAQIGREAAAVLAPFVEQAVAERMATMFGEALSGALDNSDVTRLTISGPATLFDRLARSPALAGVALVHVETDDSDLSVEIDGSVLTTRLGAFSERLAEVLP